MSLNKEKLLIESKLHAIRKEIATKEIEADMYIHTIREEASPYLSLSEIEVDRIKVAVQNLDAVMAYIAEKTREIKRLEKLL